MIHKLSESVNIISSLNSRPNLRDGLTDTELKAKFDKAANIIKDYINDVLVPEIVAKNIPFQSATGNVTGETVLEAIDWLKDQIAETQVGQIGVGTIREELLSSEVRNILNSGIPYVGDTAPEHIVGELELSDGQIWIKTESNKVVSINILSNGKWYSFGEPVLPVSRGGTGIDKIDEGAMLYGGKEKTEVLETPTEEAVFLSAAGGKPQWKNKSGVKDALGFLNVTYGQYEGTGKPRTIDLKTESGEAVTPILLYVFREGEPYDLSGSVAYNTWETHAILAQNSSNCAEAVESSTQKKNLHCIKLSEATLQLYGKRADDGAELTIAGFMNVKGSTYKWVALS